MTAASYWKFKAVNVETKSSSISQQPEQIFFIYNLIKNMENTVVYKKKCLFCLSSIASYKQEMRKSLL